ncbi:MAG: endolytic transglycosylase MltG [Candidatus Dojkabacteria bacterium]|nr:endolytic transglycosylase MltG [Candidatus Dojkabacteria bacterium]
MFKNIRSITRIFLFALVTVIVAGVFIKLRYNKIIETPNNDSSDKVVVTINEGQAVDSIINELIERDILKERWGTYLRAYLKFNDLGSLIQAGTYNIPKNLSIKEIVETLQHAQSQDIWITLPEGLRKDEIAQRLSDEFSQHDSVDFSISKFLNLTVDQTYISKFGLPVEVTNLEGYIFPDKYAFSIESTTESALTKMIETFIAKVGKGDSYETVILASMVEREGYNATDRAMIADILQRRLEEGWLLQVDATLLYPIKDWKHEITKADKDNENEYNTYRYLGLTPTPICNPGLESIKAVRNPQPNNYYFYIHEKNGTAHYAATLSDHNANINKYLR